MTAAPLHHLFSAEGEATLAVVLRQRPLVALDFDGTLAPIVPRPEDARPSQAVSARLAQLAGLLPVAIVTGRRVADVRSRLGFEPRFIVGNHGAEDEGLVPDEAALAVMADLRARMAAQGPALQAIAALLAERDEALRVFGGKLVVNVAPRHAPDKAQAVRSLMQRAGTTALVYAGDDVNDEPVFEAVQPGWLTVRVGRDDPRSRAMFCLDSPGQMPLLLDRMLALLAR